MSGCSVDIFQRKTGKRFTWLLEQTIGKVNINILPQTTTTKCMSSTNGIVVEVLNDQFLKMCQKSSPLACISGLGFRSWVYLLPPALSDPSTLYWGSPFMQGWTGSLRPMHSWTAGLRQGPIIMAMYQHLGTPPGMNLDLSRSGTSKCSMNT